MGRGRFISGRTLILLVLSLGLLTGITACKRSDPAVGVLEINRDLPIVSNGVLRLGVTLNPGTTTGRDLLGGNLLVNGSFDLAPRLAVSLHSQDTTVTTPNGFRQFYPLPEIIYGWTGSDPRVMMVRRDEGVSSGDLPSSLYLRVSEVTREGFKLLHDLTPIAVRKHDHFFFRARIRGVGTTMTAEMVRDSIGGAIISDRVTFRPVSEWTEVSGELRIRVPSDSAFLRISFLQSSPSDSTAYTGRRTSFFADIDDARLTVGESAVLDSLVTALRPYYIRFPDGLTSGGFYPGTYPLHDTSANERTSIWTNTGYEYTGDFSLEDFLKLSGRAGAQPILVENAGITNAGAGRRYEDIALLPDRVKYYEQVLERAHTDSLLLQVGYDMPSVDYPKRFREMTILFEKDSVTPFLLSGGVLVSDDPTDYSDYVADFVLPPLSSPSFIKSIPPLLRTSFTQNQPLMLGEVHFAPAGEEGRFLPAFLLRVAFLIEAEKHADALKGLSLYPLLSEKKSEMPVILVKDGRYLPTALYRYSKAFVAMSGSEIRSLDYDELHKSGLYASLTSDREESHFFLKVANTTRHPLIYDLKVLATNRPALSSIEIVRFSPHGLTTDTMPDPYLDYDVTRETLKLPLRQKKKITIGAFEAIIFHLH